MTGIFSGGGGGSSSASANAGYLDTLAQGDVNLGNLEISAAAPIYSTALGQYESGAAGNLTSAQQALVNQNLGTEQTGTMGTYGNLGLGGSTMEGQDLANNVLKSTAEQANIANQDEQLGLSGLQTAQQYYTGAGNDYTGASSALSSSGNLSQGVTNSLNSAISSLGNKSSSGSGLGSLFGSSSGGLGSLFGTGSGAGSVASEGVDAASLAL